MMIKKILILFALIFALLVPAAWADDYHISSTNIGELQTAIASADGAIIIDDAITLPNAIEISKDVTIRGNGNTITAAAGKRHFNIKSKAATFEGDITFKGGSTNGGGIEITESGSATFTGKATFTGNNTTGDGGAIYVSTGTLTFEKEAIFGGTGTTDKNTAANGGAVYVASGGTATFSEAPTFTGNTASSNGGAINSAGEVKFEKSATFTGNTASSGGGAIYVASGGTATFSEAPTFTGNKATGNGGAVYSDGGTVSFASATFGGADTANSNKATNGGAIYSTGSLSFTGAAQFTTNVASADGGAIYSTGTTSFASAAQFTTNVASGDGGAIYSTGTINFNKSPSFEDNTATRNGGAIYSTSKNLNFNDTDEQLFTGNTAGYGGAIYVSEWPNFKSSRVVFENNTAENNGGAVFLANGGSSKAFELGDKFIFSDNKTTTGSPSSSVGNGGAVYADGPLTLSGASFDVNEAAGSGGAVYAAGAITVTGGEFTGNTAGLSGGAIASAGKVTVSGINFTTQNTANGTDGGGGAIYAANVEFASGTITFSNQSAANGHGGAVYVTQGISGSGRAIFESNEAAKSGGAIRIGGEKSNTESTLSRMSFIKNKVTGDGGAVYSVNPISVTYCYFSENKSSNGNGGAIGADGSGNTYTIISSYFLNNSAANSDTTSTKIYGGAVYINQGDTLTITSSSFIFNASQATGSSAESKGGAVYTGEISSTTFTNNSFYYNTTGLDGSSNGTGGAVYLNESGNGTATVNFCTFTGNSAYGGHGGGLAVNNGSLLIRGSLIVGNTALYGSDVCKGADGGARISSGRDNRLVSYSNGDNALSWTVANGITGAADDETGSWTALSFFIATPVPDDLSSENLFFSSISVGADDSVKLPVIQLDQNKDGAIDQAVNTVRLAPDYDQRGVLRAGNGAAPDIGAFEVNQAGYSEGDDSNPYAEYTIRSIELSGIPNTLSIVGQTAILHATVTYINGTRTTTAEPLTWKSSDTNVAEFENASSGAIYTKSLGETTITVSARDGEYSASKTIYVIWEQEDTNIHPNVLNLVDQLNMQLENDNINFYVMANAPDDDNLLTDSKFIASYRDAYKAKPSFADYNSSNFSSNSSFGRAAKSGLKDAFTPGINTAVNSQYAGLLLPVFCRWEFDLEDLADEFDSDSEKIYSMSDSEFSSWLFKHINIGFARTGGKFLPAVSSSNQSNMQAAAMIRKSDDASSGALSVNRSSDSVTVSLRAYLANVTPQDNKGSSLIADSTGRKLLIIPAGSTPISNMANLSGTIWTTKIETSDSDSDSNSGSDSDSSSGSKKSGGGGCNALGLSSLVLIAALFALKSKSKF